MPTLVAVGGYGGTAESQAVRLGKDFQHLRVLGWQIDNVAPSGEVARYVMRTVDNRLRLRLSPEQKAALLRAAMLADRADLATRLGLEDATTSAPQHVAVAAEPIPHLDAVIEAVTHRCRCRFAYHGVERVADPQVVRRGSNGWYLEAVEAGASEAKTFRIDRMSEVSIGLPGSAAVVGVRARPSLDPMTWAEDEPVEVTVTLDPDFREDVVALLRRPVGEVQVEDELHLTFRVTNRDALHARLLELGPRVRIVGPAEVRDELVQRLADAAGVEVP
jgi:predicted DNA-binding transcriptional regulator YafY